MTDSPGYADAMLRTARGHSGHPAEMSALGARLGELVKEFPGGHRMSRLRESAVA